MNLRNRCQKMSKKRKRHRQRPLPSPPSCWSATCRCCAARPAPPYDLRKDADAIEAISRQIGQAPSGQAECCLWMLDDQNRPGAVLALDQATAIAEHLKEWAENQPAKWFKVYLKEKEASTNEQAAAIAGTSRSGRRTSRQNGSRST